MGVIQSISLTIGIEEVYVQVAAAAVVSLIVSLLVTPLVRTVAGKLNVVAHPGGRRVHEKPTPMLGGIAMFAGFVFATLSVLYLDSRLVLEHSTIGIIVGATMVGIIGVLDDKYELPGWFQAIWIVVAAAVLTTFGVKILYITNPLKGGHLIWLGVFSVPVTLIWMLTVTKAMDCMDGLDGLAAGITVIASLTLTVMAVIAGPGFEVSGIMAAAIFGAALGFLRYNYPPASIFMGTVGAQFLGFSLAGIAVREAFKIPTFVAIIVPLILLSVPLADTTFVVMRRAKSGRKIHEADTSHLHHRLVEAGLTKKQVIWSIYALTFLSCAIALALFYAAQGGV